MIPHLGEGTKLVIKLLFCDFSKFSKFFTVNSQLFLSDIFYVGIAATLKQKLHAQTWINNGNNLPSWCSKDYEVHNITSIKFSDGVTFPTENDHSKWCVADDCVKKPLVCIGDINRQVRFQMKIIIMCMIIIREKQSLFIMPFLFSLHFIPEWLFLKYAQPKIGKEIDIKIEMNRNKQL